MTKEKSSLRIALVCNTAWAIYTYRQGVLRMLTAAGAQVTIIAPRDRTFEPLTEMGCRCVELPVASKGTDPRQDFRTLAALYREWTTALFLSGLDPATDSGRPAPKGLFKNEGPSVAMPLTQKKK